MAQIHIGQRPLLMINNPHGHTEGTGLSKIRHQVLLSTSEVLGTLSSYLDFASDDKNPLAGYPVFPTEIYRRGGRCSYVSCWLMRRNPFRVASDEDIELVGWAVLMSSCSAPTPYDWSQNNWICQPTTLRRTTCIKLYGTDSHYSEFKLIAKSYFRSARFSQKMFYRETQSNGWNAYLDAMVCGFAHFIDHCQMRVH